MPTTSAAEVGVADAAVHLAAGDDRHFASLDQADPAAEVGMTSSFEPEAEREDVVALEEEGALLGEEQREPRQVRPPRVDLGFGEVGVHRRRREHVRAEALRDVEAGLKFAFDAARRAPACRRRRSRAGRTLRPDAEVEVRQTR